MKSDDIIRYPNSLLSQKSLEVTEFTDSLSSFAFEMRDFVINNNAVGLAAVQAGKLLRIVAILHPEKEDEAIILINPKIVKTSWRTAMDEEGCLSLPDLWLKIRRPKTVEVEAVDVSGKPFSLKFEGYLARGMLHEMDHLDGKLIWDIISPIRRKRAQKTYLANIG